MPTRPMWTSDTAPTGGWLATVTVATGILVLVTSELLPVGLLTAIGADLGVPDARVGLMVTVPGLVAAVAAPTVTVLARRFDRRRVLCVLMAGLAVANLVTAWAASFGVVLGARVLVGVSIGGYWAIAGGLAVRLVREPAVGRATSVILGGVAVAAVFGVPLGTLLGDLGSWRTPFVASGVAASVVAAALATTLPSLPRCGRGSGGRELVRLAAAPDVRFGLLVTALVVTGHFAAYTYLRPVIEELTAAGPRGVSAMLLAFGVAGIVGNALAGEVAHLPGRTRLLLVASTLTFALLAVPAFAGTTPVTTFVLCAWGLAYGAAGVTLQTWMLQAAPRATEPATALLSATFNVSIALGAILGGLVVDRIGPTSVTGLGATLVGLATLSSAAAVLRGSRGSRGAGDRGVPEHRLVSPRGGG